MPPYCNCVCFPSCEYEKFRGYTEAHCGSRNLNVSGVSCWEWQAFSFSYHIMPNATCLLCLITFHNVNSNKINKSLTYDLCPWHRLKRGAEWGRKRIVVSCSCTAVQQVSVTHSNSIGDRHNARNLPDPPTGGRQKENFASELLTITK